MCQVKHGFLVELISHCYIVKSTCDKYTSMRILFVLFIQKFKDECSVEPSLEAVPFVKILWCSAPSAEILDVRCTHPPLNFCAVVLKVQCVDCVTDCQFFSVASVQLCDQNSKKPNLAAFVQIAEALSCLSFH